VKSRILVASALALALGAAQAQEGRGVRVGDVAPIFTLTDTAGATHTLEQHRGKVVVLEWFNPDCPAVKLHHQRNKTMKETSAALRGRDVVWLAINSGAPGKQGHGRDRNARAISEYEIEYPVLLDETGVVGHAYGAVCTPHMFVIDAQGRLAYAGAIDDGSMRGPGQTNHVQRAVEALLGARAPETRDTRPYG
jgi:peroxiredoxin